mgnify:CR=1 FL=1
MIWLFIILAVALIALALAPQAAAQLALVAAWGLMAVGVLIALAKAVFY